MTLSRTGPPCWDYGIALQNAARRDLLSEERAEGAPVP